MMKSPKLVRVAKRRFIQAILRHCPIRGGRDGNVFLIIIGILAVIFIMATFFMQTTVEEKHQTERSNRVVQAQCMAEAGLELATSFLASEANNPDGWRNTNSFAHQMRLPLAKQPGKKLEGLKSNLGDDVLLDTGTVLQPIIVTGADLDPETRSQLDTLFTYMAGDDPAATYSLEVTFKLEKAFSNSPGDSVEGGKYKIPGIDMEWECHSGVKEFLDNKGYPAIKLCLPDGLTWLKFEIPVQVMGKTLFSFDLIDLLKKPFPDGAMAEILDKTDLHKLLEWVFKGTGLYPYEITLAANIFPPLADKMGGISLPSGLNESQTIEKYGYFSVESKASLSYPDNKTVVKTILATKEFKCADIEPVSPLYSFFVSNLNDSKIGFNNLGGNLYVNNFSNLGAIKGSPAHPEKREFPGLVRVNGTQRMDVNLSVMGNPLGPDLYPGDNFAKKIARGCEWLLMADLSVEMKSYNANQGVVVSVKESQVSRLADALPGKLKGVAETGIKKLEESPSPPAGKADAKSKGPLTDLVKLSLNIIPPTKFGIKIWEAPLHFLTGNPSGFGIWELPYCGNSWNQMTMPLPFFSPSVTHFFGSCGIFPPLTREIEGNVAKRYRQWNLGVISYPMGPIPLGNQIPTPWGIMILPFPIPLWHTHTIVNKYEYNLWTLKTEDSQTNPGQLRVYDPGLMQNSPPNLYSIEQYAKKASYYYGTQQDFVADLESRIVKENGKDCFKLKGVTFIRDSITLPPPGVAKFTGGFTVCGRGMIVCGGNVTLNGNIEDPYTDAEERNDATPRTQFSLVVRQGGLIVGPGAPQSVRVEGSLYTDKSVAVSTNKSLHIVGNWITNIFSKALTRGDILVDYTPYKCRSSLNSIHPTMGKYDPERYFISFAPGWEAWRVK